MVCLLALHLVGCPFETVQSIHTKLIVVFKEEPQTIDVSRVSLTNDRLRKRLSQPGRLVVETANVDAIRKWGLTLYAPEDVDTLYFLSERSPGVWAYYSITRVLPNSVLAEGHDESFINRAVALYRHYMGLPTDAEPPAAR